jgi:hypothetical protein
MAYNIKNYAKQDGNEWVVGGTLTLEDGAVLQRGTTITASIGVVQGTITYNVADPFTVSLGTIPAGATILHALVAVTTAFNAGTTNVLVVGTAATADAYVAAADVNEAATGTTVVAKAAGTALTAATSVFAKYTQTGTPADAGSARVMVFYAV